MEISLGQATNRVTTSGYQYDVNGNMIRSLAEDGSTWVKYEYDAANRLNIVRKDDANQTQLERFQYDSTNARVQSHDFAQDRYKSHLNAGGTAIAEFTEFTVGVPKWTKSYTYMGGSQLATITPNGGYTAEITEFNHPDGLGTRLVTNQSANTSAEQAHLPFGRPLDAETSPPLATNNKRFTSYDRSNKTSLDYAVNRTYDSKLGRFTQVDPIGIQAASTMAPQTLNMYSYCVNDPINYIDPSGLFIGQFFRWLGRVLLGLSRSRVARRIAIKFVVNYALSGGNFGVAIRSVLPDILQSTGLFPDPRSTVPWMKGTRLPISLGTSSLSKYIILNFGQVEYDSAQQAAIAFLKLFLAMSKRIKREIAAVICKLKNGKFIYGRRQILGKDGGEIKNNCPKNSQLAGGAHTHWSSEKADTGDPEADRIIDRYFSNELPSGTDWNWVRQNRVPHWLATPTGEIHRMDTDGKIATVSKIYGKAKIR